MREERTTGAGERIGINAKALVVSCWHLFVLLLRRRAKRQKKDLACESSTTVKGVDVSADRFSVDMSRLTEEMRVPERQVSGDPYVWVNSGRQEQWDE